jgi:uncharacterized protein YktB (UPF0637 family)
MATKANAATAPLEAVEIAPLAEVEIAAAFGGFTPEDFAVFEVPGFEARMLRLRADIKPKLALIGAAITPRLSETLGETVYPHVAQHLRRTVHAPEETWVAFARSPRAYKPFVHLRVAVRADKARVTVFVEDDADEKATFAANLARSADALADYLAHHPHILACELRDDRGEPGRGSALTADTLRAFAGRMNRFKGQHAVFGIAFDKSHPVVASGPEFLDAVAGAADTLKPLYDCGKPDFVYTYTPEPITI